MLDLLRELILDFQQNLPDPGFPRHLEIEPISGKATVCIGVRRAGKSTYLHQVIDRLVREGVDRQSILYINFFDDRLYGLGAESIGLVAEAYYGLFPEKKNAETVYCFFDEIQSVEGWEAFVDRMLRSEKVEVWLTGSSAAMLSKEIGTRMRGRSLAWEIFPFSFEEFLDYRGAGLPGHLSTRDRLLVGKAFADYFEIGGFPEVLDLDRRLRVRTHQEYLNAILFRDLIERHSISHPNALRDLAQRLIGSVGSLYTINKQTERLKSLGYSVPKASVSDWIGWFEDAFFLFTVEIFDASIARRRTNPKKIYCIDHALVRSVSSGILVDDGHLLENYVYTTLRRATERIYYYKTARGKEVDFIAIMPDGSRQLVQVSRDLASEQTRSREVDALSEAMEELGIERGTIVTMREREEIDVAAGVVEVRAAWEGW